MSCTDNEAIAYINGKRFVLPPGRGEVTLLTFLRGESLRMCQRISLLQQPKLRRERPHRHKIRMWRGRVSSLVT